jgi:hypothetical protein
MDPLNTQVRVAEIFIVLAFTKDRDEPFRVRRLEDRPLYIQPHQALVPVEDRQSRSQ